MAKLTATLVDGNEMLKISTGISSVTIPTSDSNIIIGAMVKAVYLANNPWEDYTLEYRGRKVTATVKAWKKFRKNYGHIWWV